MFREMHYMDRGLRAMDLAESMAERRRRSLIVTRNSFRGTWMARMFFELAGISGSSHAEGRA